MSLLQIIWRWKWQDDHLYNKQILSENVISHYFRILLAFLSVSSFCMLASLMLCSFSSLQNHHWIGDWVDLSCNFIFFSKITLIKTTCAWLTSEDGVVITRESSSAPKFPLVLESLEHAGVPQIWWEVCVLLSRHWVPITSEPALRRHL